MSRALPAAATQTQARGPAAGLAGAVPDGLRRWLMEHLPPGRTLNVGSAPWPFPERDLDHLEVPAVNLGSLLAYGVGFDSVWVNDLPADTEPDSLIRQVFQALNLSGSLVLTVAFGLTRGQPGPRALYPNTVRRLLEPYFQITTLELVGGFIAVTGSRRHEPAGDPVFALDEEELAFLAHDRHLNKLLDESSAQLLDWQAKHREAVSTISRLRSERDRAQADLAKLRRKVARIKRLLTVPLAVLAVARQLRRTVRWRRRATAPLWSRQCESPDCKRLKKRSDASDRPSGTTTTTTTSSTTSSTTRNADTAAATRPASATTATTASTRWREEFLDRFESWLRTAQEADGDEVVVMFSGTTFVQEHRGNRPIRLTKVYLERSCPVFFNYYRWTDKDPLPDHGNELLFQSPIDLTPSLLDALLTADFGDKKRIFFASFPHLLMVRYLTVAAQHGWVTVYDARDDWEEFAKVGMAKWYHPGYERYVATHADITTAVSRPLARKMVALAGGATVHVVPNALDTAFPRPSEPGAPPIPPVIGYFGHLTDKWFDWPLVIAAADRYPDFTFELAGHQQPQLELPRNIKLLGLLDHQELAERSRNWSLAIIPFKNGPLADAVDPIKIYEYLHLGLPVLATYLPQCRDYPGTTITEGREEFLERLPQVAGTEVPQPDLAKWLEVNTWDKRVDTYSILAGDLRRVGRRGATTLLGGGW